MTPIEREFARIESAEDELVALLSEWVGTNSGSWHETGLANQQARLKDRFSRLGGVVREETMAPSVDESTQQPLPAGERRVLSIKKRPEAPLQVMLVGHYDTVYGSEDAFQSPERASQTMLRGPGCADMKGGLVVMLSALEAFERLAEPDCGLGWTVFLNPDEEIGSIWSEPLLIEHARTNDAALVFEPTLPDGGLVSARKGSGTFTFTAHGKAAHAGRDFSQGRNAICLLAKFVLALDALNYRRDGVTINVGRIEGGGASNIVPALASCKVNVRTVIPEDEAWFLQHAKTIRRELNQQEGFGLEMSGRFSSSPKPETPGTRVLLNAMAEISQDLGVPLSWAPTGGACDGNRLQALGLPTLDSLGVVGANLHSDGEFMVIPSLTERAKMNTLLLRRLAQGEVLSPRAARM
jgi:glutamate carboxypeptidase